MVFAGTPQASWAIESQMDEAARQLGIDRLEIRLRNLAKRGEEVVRGDKPADGDWAQAVGKAATRIEWGTPLGRGRGRGIAVAIKASATTGASYVIRPAARGRQRDRSRGHIRHGAGRPHRPRPDPRARSPGAPIDRIAIVMGDTGTVPFDLQTSASRSTVFMGMAVLDACQDIKAQLRTMAARALALPESQVTVDPGLIRLPSREVRYGGTSSGGSSDRSGGR